MTGEARTLVTGGAGAIGSALVRRLVREGERVRVLDDLSRTRPGRLQDLEGSIEFERGDVRDPAVVESAVRGVSAIWHLAAVNGTEHFYSRPEVVLEVGVKGMMNVIDAALRHDVREIFVASSSEVYQSPTSVPTDESVPLTVPDPLNPRYSYAGTKIISELLAINFGRRHIHRVIVFRPHNVYGPDMGWEHVIPQLTVRIRDLCRSTTGRISVPIQGDGSQTRAFVHIDDAVEALMILAARGEHLGVYHVGADEEIRIDRLALEIARCFGREADVVPGEPMEGATTRRCPDVRKLRVLGYEPRIPLREGLCETVRWYDAHAGGVPNVG